VKAPAPAPASAPFTNEQISQVNVFNIRAIAVRGNQVSDVFTRNYVMGTDVNRRFCQNTLIFVLNSDPHGLYDYHDGILVEGIDRDDWRQDFFNTHGVMPGPEHEHPFIDANYTRRTRDAERLAHVEMFDHRGNLHISQRVGIRVRGGWSRGFYRKSLELYAREEYGDRNNFPFAFFLDEFDAEGELMDRFRRVRLRNGGSDRYDGFIRDELSQSLFRQAGMITTQSHTPAAVFINGEYYGVAWLKSPRTENHLRRVYGGETDNFAYIQGGDYMDRSDSWWGPTLWHMVVDFHEVHELARRGFTGTEGQRRFEEFSRRVDVDDLIRYYAMQIYINNYDWPNWNFELWRYFPTAEELADPNLHPYLRDGKWRVFAHDLEQGWAIYDHEDARVNEDTIWDILNRVPRVNSGGGSAFLTAFVSREDTKAQLANTFADLIEGVFAPANIIRTLDGLVARIQNELHYSIKANVIDPVNPWYSVDSYTQSHERIRRFARNRPNVMWQSVQRNLGFDRTNMYTVNLTTNANGGAVMNSRPVAPSQRVSGNYFANTSIKITAQPNKGYIVSHWTVNGERQTGNVITVSGAADVAVHFVSGTAVPDASVTAPNIGTASAWAVEHINAAHAKGFIPTNIQNNYTQNITRAEFAQLAVKWLEYVLDKNIGTILSERGLTIRQDAFTDTTDSAILAAFALDIINGTSPPTATTSGVFTSNGELTREQAATMLLRACRAAGMDVSNTASSGLGDIDSAASWAVDAVNFVFNQRIMTGSNNMFSPKGAFTREQSIITFNNIR
jgi:hypothetical protein